MKKYVTWSDVEQYAQKLKTYCDGINFVPDGIFGPARGGIPFREIVADVMGIKKRLVAPKKEALHIDDIADSGATLVSIQRRKTHQSEYLAPTKGGSKAKAGDFFITTMYYHPRSTVTPDFYMFEKSKSVDDPGEWISFPFEEVNAREEDIKELNCQIASKAKIDVTWNQVEGFLYDLHLRYEKGLNPTGIYGIRGGGELLAAWFSNGFDLDMLDAPCEGCIIVNDFAKFDECECYKNCQIVSMFGQESGDSGMFKVSDYERVILPYKRKAILTNTLVHDKTL